MFDYKGPIVTIIMDGIGLRDSEEGNAVKLSYTPVLDKLFEEYQYTSLKAHGTAVGLPSDDDMGNSEVGHNAIGAGAVYSQGAKLVNESIESGEMYKAKGWTEIIANAKSNKSTLHFIGLFSDGNVHSHIDHLKAMIKQAKNEGINKVRVHILLDGRDVGETSALDYVVPFEEYIAALCDGNFDVKESLDSSYENLKSLYDSLNEILNADEINANEVELFCSYSLNMFPEYKSQLTNLENLDDDLNESVINLIEIFDKLCEIAEYYFKNRKVML